MASTTVGALIVKLTAQTRQFDTAMQRAPKQLGGLQQATAGASAALAALSRRLLAAAAAYVSVNKVMDMAQQLDEIGKFSDRIGIGVEQLQRLRYAAKLSGIEAGTLEMALQRMTRRVAEAAKDTGEAKAALQEMGLNAKHLASLSPDQQFMRIASALEKFAKQGDKVRLAMRLFDSEGVALVQMLDGLIDKMEEANGVGVFTEEQVDRVEEMNNKIVKLKESLGGLGKTIAVELSDPMSTFADSLATWISGAPTGRGGKQTSFNDRMMGTMNYLHAWIVEKAAATFAGTAEDYQKWQQSAEAWRRAGNRRWGLADPAVAGGSDRRVNAENARRAREARQRILAENLADPTFGVPAEQLDNVRKRLSKLVGSDKGTAKAAQFIAATSGVGSQEQYEMRMRATFQAPQSTQQNILEVLRKQLAEEEKQRQAVEQLLKQMTREEILAIPE